MVQQLDMLAGEPDVDPLVGFAFDGITVTGVAGWNPAYLLVDTPKGPSCRPRALVLALFLDGQS